MQREPVTSSNVRSIGYEEYILEVEFKGGLYQYLGVPQQIYENLMLAESKGKFINDNIKPNFVFRRVAPT